MRFRRDLCAISLRRRAGAALVAVREPVGVARLHVGVPGGEVGVELVGQRQCLTLTGIKVVLTTL